MKDSEGHDERGKSKGTKGKGKRQVQGTDCREEKRGRREEGERERTKDTSLVGRGGDLVGMEQARTWQWNERSEGGSSGGQPITSHCWWESRGEVCSAQII